MSAKSDSIMNQDHGSALSIDEIMHNVAKEVAYRATYQLDQTPVSLRPQPVPKMATVRLPALRPFRLWKRSQKPP